MNLIAFVTLIVIAFASAQSSCPCAHQSLCNQITTQFDKELFAFQAFGDAWEDYPWDKVIISLKCRCNSIQITTVAIFGTEDPQIMCTAHENGVKVVLAPPYPKEELTNSTYLQLWIEQQIEAVEAFHADGINVDFESAIDPSQAPSLTQMMKQTYTAFKAKSPYYQVTFDAAWSPNCIDERCYDFLGLSLYSDFLVIMDYDLRSQIYGPCVASANSPLDLVIQGMEAFMSLGIPSSKLVMGLPWYGYDYPCIEFDGKTCAITPVPFRGANCSDAAGSQYGYNDIQSWLQNNVTSGRQWDSQLLAPYFSYTNGGQTYQVWYDDAESISYKVTYAKKAQLHGVSMWTADYLDYKGHPEDAAKMWRALEMFFV
jgi:di-N-acetylchitobiase